MKKFTALFSMILAVLFFAVTAFAAETADISFDTYESEESGNICVDVVISESGSPSMMQFCIAYDEDILECIIAAEGDAFSGNNAPIINQIDGKIYFIWDSLTPLGPGGTMLHLEFTAKEKEDTSVGIDLEETFIVANSGFEEIGNITGSAEIDLSDDKPEDSDSSIMKPEDEQEKEEAEQEQKPEEAPEEDESLDIIEKLETETEIKVDENTVLESDDENVVKVEDGKIVPVSPGTTTITVTTEDGEKEATVEVTVKEDGTVETEEIEVLKNNSPKESSFSWVIFLPIGAALVAAFALMFKKIKNR